MCVRVRVGERRNVLVCMCICTGVWWITCCDSRHHADFISVIAACQPGALGTSVKMFYILLSALNVCVFFFLYQYFETTLSCRVYSPQQTNTASLQLRRWLDNFLINSNILGLSVFQRLVKSNTIKTSSYAQQYQQTYLRKSVDEGIGSPIFLIMAGVFGVVAVGGAK